MPPPARRSPAVLAVQPNPAVDSPRAGTRWAAGGADSPRGHDATAIIAATSNTTAVSAATAMARRRGRGGTDPLGGAPCWGPAPGGAIAVRGPLKCHHGESVREWGYELTSRLGTGCHTAVIDDVRALGAVAAAPARAEADRNRAAGSFAIAVAITASRPAGSDGTRSLTRGGGCCRWADITAAIPLAAENGVFPVSSRNRAQPNEYKSAQPSNGMLASTSGAA